MADSQSNSRKAFPETGSECRQPRGQEEMIYLKGHRVSDSAFALGWPLTLQAQNQPSSWSQLCLDEGVKGALLAAWRRDEPSCIKNCPPTHSPTWSSLPA